MPIPTFVNGWPALTLLAARPFPRRRVQFTPVFKVLSHLGKSHSAPAARPAGTLPRAPSNGGSVDAPMPRSPAASRPQPSPRAPKPGKSPRAAAGPGAAPPSAKRARRDVGSGFGARKASTPATPSGSHSGSEEGATFFGAAGAASAPRRSDDHGAARGGRAAEPDDPDAALARRLHAELNCTPARTSRLRAAAACAVEAAPRDRAHGNDPGLLPSC